MPFYCYQCEQTVEADQRLHCPLCDGEFIEEITSSSVASPQATISFVVGSGRQDQANPLDSVPPFLRNLLGATAGPSSRGGLQAPAPFNMGASVNNEQSAQGSMNNYGSQAEIHQVPNNQPSDVLGQFLNQLMANLSSGVPQGGHIHIQIGSRGEGRGMRTNLGDYAFGDANFDEIITQLLNGYEQTVGLSKAEIRKLPITTVTRSHVDNGTQCTTCMDTFALDEEVAKLDCKHIYHKECIVPWLERQKTCPICRQAIDPSNWPDVEDDRVITDVDELD